jgi:hypothetical protein
MPQGTLMPGISQTLKDVIRNTPLYPVYRNFRNERAAKKRKARLHEEYESWLRNGSPVPPPHLVKQRAIKEYAAKYRPSIFIETGTYMGDMVDAFLTEFEVIYSIELDRQLCNDARVRFRKHPHVNILLGDSGQVLTELLPRIGGGALFWLDGHYSGGITAKGAVATPILSELREIFSHKHAREHIILIDDARMFNGHGDYPTLAAIEHLARDSGFTNFSVADDIIRLTNPSSIAVSPSRR